MSPEVLGPWAGWRNTVSIAGMPSRCPVDGAGTRQNLWDVRAQPPPPSQDRHAGRSLSGKKREMLRTWLLRSGSSFSTASEQSRSWSWETI